MILATYEDFEDGGLYDPPYSDFDYFRWRADAIKEYFSDMKTIAVWGCGWGYLVKYLTEDFIVVGYDASEYALSKKVTQHIYLADCTKADEVPGVIVDLLITEDLLPCLTDDEITVALPLLRSTSDTVCHIVSSLDHGRNHNQRLNWKTQKEWRKVLEPDFCMNPNGQPFHR